MQIHKKTIFPVLGGFVAASLVTMSFEFANSLFFPFPEGFDMYDVPGIQAFTLQYSPEIFYLVLIGWTAGACVGGYITALLSGEVGFRHGAVLAALLVLVGILNHLMVHQPLWFNIIAFPALLGGVYLGRMLQKGFLANTFEKSK